MKQRIAAEGPGPLGRAPVLWSTGFDPAEPEGSVRRCYCLRRSPWDFPDSEVRRAWLTHRCGLHFMLGRPRTMHIRSTRSAQIKRGHHVGATRPDLSDSTDRDRRPGPTNALHATCLDRGCAGGLWRTPAGTPQRGTADPAGHLSEKSDPTTGQRGGLSGDGVVPLPGCIPGEGTSGEAAWGATAGAGAGCG